MSINSILYVTDLDGTLLTSDKRVGSRTAEILRRLVADGVLLTYATSRSWATTSAIIGDLRSRAPIILHNGAVTFDPASGTVLAHRVVDESAVATILQACRRRALEPLVHTIEDGRERASWVANSSDPGLRTYWADRQGDPRRAPRGTWAELPTTGVIGVSAIGSRTAVAGLATELEGSLAGTCVVSVRPDTYHPDWTWSEFVAAGVSKGAAVRLVAERVGATRTVVFGDNVNDLQMFAVADEAYAVANAVEPVRRAAHAVIGANDDDGVAAWLAAHAVPARC